MANPAEYTNRRWIVMQLVLWGIFGATVALAALIDNKQAWLRNSNLSAVVTEGPVSYRLPAGWKKSFGSDDTIVVAQEPDDDDGNPGRTLSIIRTSTGRTMLPLEFIEQAQLVDPSLEKTFYNTSDGSDWTAPTICGWPAEMFQFSARPSRGPDGEPVYSQGAIIVARVLPGGNAVAVVLTELGPPGPDDSELLGDVAASISIKGVAPAPAAGGVVKLSNGVQIAIAAPGVIEPATDERLTDRDVWFSQPDGAQMLVELEPYQQFADQDAGSAADALAVHNLVWSAAPAAPLATVNGVRQWKISPMMANGLPAPMQAFVAADANGHGVIAIYHMLTAGRHGGNFEQAWSDLAPHITFDAKAPDPAGFLSAGAARVKQIAADPHPNDSPPAGAWWEWTRPDTTGAIEPVGWSHFDQTRPALMQTRRLLWNDHVARWTTQWGLAGGDIVTLGYVTRLDMADSMDNPGGKAPPFTYVESEATSLTDTQMTLAVDFRLHIAPHVVARPAQFVAGAGLTGVLGRIANDPDFIAPIVVRTDWPAGWARSPGIWNALSLILHPAAAAESPRAGGSRAVDVEINGSGESSRWFFHADGSFDHAEFPGGGDVRPVEAQEIVSAFAGDPRMNPAGN